ncbi:hypothetical protein DCAR_0418172 [Daucus carota subsp. sativus]|uniref:Uncharacterized protein n=1 Tax=Daucus carota subsp. sativus TaxID=79200 RepID=A0AAF0WZK5_DAUCS|nr:PREDICTED: uncharacterized protein LOC108216264 [Daucus carota subsp. sativus]WOG98827.1 hypothetical protein DCAR_0418172 [Daucus carota subsp. sativus]
MSFLAGGRLAGKEAAYFFQESKQAVSRLVDKNKKITSYDSFVKELQVESSESADILPEILRHSLPSKLFRPPTESSSDSLSATKWALPYDPKSFNSVSRDAINPLKSYVSLPQVTFGPKRWQLPNAENSFVASTANDSRQDKYVPVNPEKLKAAAAGFSEIAKAFAAATAIVFGGATLMFGLAASKLELRGSDDLRIKGRELVNPRFEMIKERVIPLRTWAEGMSKKWHFEKEQDVKNNPLLKELSKQMGAKSSS